MMRAMLIRFVLCFSAFLAAPATGQPCLDYSSGDIWLPNPISAAGEQLIASATWNNCLVVATSQGARTVDFTDPLVPAVIASRPDVYRDVAVDGNVAVFCAEEHFDIVLLPQLQLYRRIFVSDANPLTLRAAVQGHRIVVAAWNWLRVYEWPESGPFYVTLRSEFIPADGPLWYNFDPDPDLSLVGDNLVMVSFSNSGASIRGGLATVVSLANPDLPIVTDRGTQFPVDTGMVPLPKFVTPAGSGFLVSGDSQESPNWWARKEAFLAWFGLGPDGRIVWRDGVTVPSTSLGDIVVAGARTLWPLEDGTRIVALDHGSNELSVQPGTSAIAPGNLCWIPPASVLASGTMTYRLDSWDLADRSFGIDAADCAQHFMFSLNNSVCLELDSQCFVPYDGSYARFRTWDLTGAVPTALGNVSGPSFDEIHDIAAADNGIYVVDGTVHYVDIRDPTHPTAPVDLGLPAYRIVVMDTLLVTHANGVLNLVSHHADNTTTVVGTLPSYGGDLVDVNGLVYMASGVYSRIVDISDPTTPVATPVVLGNGSWYVLAGDILLGVDGRTVTRTDVSDPRAPVRGGSQTLGAQVVDLAVSGDRVYVSHGAMGTAVYSLTFAEGLRYVGGDIIHRSSSLELLPDRLLIEPGRGSIPLDCEDPLPVLLAALTAEPTPVGVRLTWRCTYAAPGADWRISRGSGGAMVEIARRPVAEGEQSHLDSQYLPPGPVTYAIEMCPAGDSCNLAGQISLNVVAGPTQLRPTLGVGPNPTFAGTTASLMLPAAGAIELVVFDLSGRRVRTLAQSVVDAGEHEIPWDGTDQSGRRAPAGMYVIRLSTPAGATCARVAILR